MEKPRKVHLSNGDECVQERHVIFTKKIRKDIHGRTLIGGVPLAFVFQTMFFPSVCSGSNDAGLKFNMVSIQIKTKTNKDGGFPAARF